MLCWLESGLKGHVRYLTVYSSHCLYLGCVSDLHKNWKLGLSHNTHEIFQTNLQHSGILLISLNNSWVIDYRLAYSIRNILYKITKTTINYNQCGSRPQAQSYKRSAFIRRIWGDGTPEDGRDNRWLVCCMLVCVEKEELGVEKGFGGVKRKWKKGSQVMKITFWLAIHAFL